MKTRHFAITNSLRDILEKSGLSEQDQERLAYIQNKVLTVVDEGRWAFVPRTYWSDKCGWGYKRYVDMLREWKQLDVNLSYWHGHSSDDSFPKSYRVPEPALADGICHLNFKRKRFHSPKPENNPTDEVSDYALECLNLLTVVPDKLFWLPDDPIRRAKIHDSCENIAFKNFQLHYGENVNRLFHNVLTMPSEGRQNLVHPFYPLVESDVKSCHPLLLVKLFTDANEKERYQAMLTSDIYNRIVTQMGLSDRDQVKVDFLRVVNAKKKNPDWLKQEPVFNFFAEEFPIFTKQVLSVRTDLANHLQNFEAELMVQRLGSRCKKNQLFWFPQHDGWISTTIDNDQIAAHASEIILEAIGFLTEITTEPLNQRLYLINN